MVQIGMACASPDPSVRLPVPVARTRLLALANSMSLPTRMSGPITMIPISTRAASARRPTGTQPESPAGPGQFLGSGCATGSEVSHPAATASEAVEAPTSSTLRWLHWQGPPEAADASSELDCVVCMDAPRSKRFEPCGHGTCCSRCAMDIFEGQRPCPTCRAAITRIAERSGEEPTFFQVLGPASQSLLVTTPTRIPSRTDESVSATGSSTT
jgi:hypothetical protein